MKKRVTVKAKYWVVLIVAFLLCIAIGRLIFVSVSKNVDGMDLKKFASSRNTTTKTLYASRGTIYDSAGEALALSVNSYTLIAYLDESRTTDPNKPQHVTDIEATAEALAPILGADKQTLVNYMSKDAYQVEFGKYGKDLTETVKEKIDDLELPGIDFIVGTQRYYKMGDFASYIVGYAKTDEETGEINGELGIESYYNDELSGTDGYETYQKDAAGYQLPNVPSYTQEAESGSDIYLTIDSNIQLIAENALDKLSEDYTYDWGIITVMNAKTGAIVASATAPSFDPNDLNTLTSYQNPLVSYAYEPGSTMKTFSWSAAMEEGWYNGSDTYMSGSIEVADVKISDFNKVGWGYVAFDTGYAYSSNVGATNLALKLGQDKLRYYYDRFGFGKKTGIELSGEVEGDISFKYKSELATASFGQGITVTPIQLLQAYSSVTNDGIMIKPYIVDKIVDSKGKVTYEGKRTEVERTMSSETAAYIKKLMHNANYEGLSKSWQPKTVTMAMKTGTAQIASDEGGYMTGDTNYIYSLAGIFPEDNPEYIIYVAVKRIQGPQRAVANMSTGVVDSIAAYAKITETESDVSSNAINNMQNYISKKTSDVTEQVTSNGYNIVVIGDGKYVKNQFPKAGSKIVRGTRVFILTNSDKILMPNISGWSISDVNTYSKLTGLNLTYEGYGYVTSQSISENAEIHKDDLLSVVLATKTSVSTNTENTEDKKEN